MKKLRLALFLLCGLWVTGCGSSDVLQNLGDPDVNPAIILPVPASALAGVTPFFSGNTIDGLLLTTAGVNANAPYEGVVTQLSSDGGLVSVSVMHNALLTTRVSRLLNSNVRVGDRVSGGQPIGLSGGQVLISVYANGQAVCPYSYFDPASRATINSRLLGVLPCQ